MNRKLYYTHKESENDNLVVVYIITKISKANNRVSIMEIGFIQNGLFFEDNAGVSHKDIEGLDYYSMQSRQVENTSFVCNFVELRSLDIEMPAKFKGISSRNLNTQW